MHLRRNYDGWLYRQLGFLIPHDNGGRRDLLQRSLRRMSLRRRKHITVTSASSTAYDFLRDGKCIGVGGRRDQSHNLPFLALRNLMADENSTQQQKDEPDVHDRRNRDAIRPIVVVLTPDLVGWTRSAQGSPVGDTRS